MRIDILNEKVIIDIINKMIFKTIGCTEPVAIALAVIVAYKEIGGKIKSVLVYLDKNVYKNVMAVGIPGTEQKGPKIAIALGLVCGDPGKGLLLLEDVGEKEISEAKKILEKDLINIAMNESATSLSIQAEIETENGRAKAVIGQCHDNVILIEKNGQIIYHHITNSETDTVFLGEYNFAKLDFDHLLGIIGNISEDKLAFLQEKHVLNKKAGKLGIEKCAGMGLGAAYKRLVEEGRLANNFVNQVKMLVAGAVDARMGGMKVLIFGCAGSGNHGISFFLTTGICFEYFQVEKKLQLQAYAFGLIILAAIKHTLGLLSSVCGGAIAAGAAATAAITYALGGNSEQILNSINLIIGNISGMVCDGAKFGCSLKVATGAELAIESSLLALKNIYIPKTDGIIGNSFDETVNNLGLLNKQGMGKVEETILKVLQEKKLLLGY